MQPLSETGEESLDRAFTFELEHINIETREIEYGSAKPKDLLQYAIDMNTVFSERSPTILTPRISKALSEFQSQINSAAEKEHEGFRSKILTGIGFILAPHKCKPGVPLWIIMANSLLDKRQSEVGQSHGAVDTLADESPGVRSTTKQSIMDARTASEHTEDGHNGVGHNDRGQWWWSKDTGPVQSECGQWSHGGDTKGVTMNGQ